MPSLEYTLRWNKESQEVSFFFFFFFCQVRWARPQSLVWVPGWVRAITNPQNKVASACISSWTNMPVVNQHALACTWNQGNKYVTRLLHFCWECHASPPDSGLPRSIPPVTWYGGFWASLILLQWRELRRLLCPLKALSEKDIWISEE